MRERDDSDRERDDSDRERDDSDREREMTRTGNPPRPRPPRTALEPSSGIYIKRNGSAAGYILNATDRRPVGPRPAAVACVSSGIDCPTS
jgi:hypothetical protein